MKTLFLMNHPAKKVTMVALLLLLSGFLSGQVMAWDRGKAEKFVLLPEGTSNPEALTADNLGNLYVSTFFTGEIHSYTPEGKLIRSIQVTPSSGMLLDLAFHPQTGALLVIDFGAKKVLEVNPFTGDASEFAQIPGETAGPNVLTFDASGNVYVSDSFQATIWRIPATGGTATSWLYSELLATSGFPPFGANGLAFNKAGSVLYVANTGEDTIVKVTINQAGMPESAEVLVNGINGPDGLIVDNNDYLWVAENQSNQIVVLHPSGKAVAVYGDFEGVDHNGIVKGLLFPADIILIDQHLYVTNFALDVTALGLTQNTTTAYTQQVSRYSIARFKIDHKIKAGRK